MPWSRSNRLGVFLIDPLAITRPQCNEQSMNTHAFDFCGTRLEMLCSGALWWPEKGLLCVSDLHLGKSERIARRGGTMIPPYDVRETLARLQDDLSATRASRVVCLGDSFDDLAAAQALPEEARREITCLQAGRDWIWIEGNHDPGPIELGGSHRSEFRQGALVFRHIARSGATGEISGHYHPKMSLVLRGRMIHRPALLYDSQRVILPAYGTYTGGLRWNDPVFGTLFEHDAMAILTGPTPRAVPVRLTRDCT